MNIQDLKTSLLQNKTSEFNKLYHSVKPYCLSILKSKQSQLDNFQREAIYDDAIIIFKDNLLTNKLLEDTTPKSYLAGVCLNLAKNQVRKEYRYQSKLSELRLLNADHGHNTNEDNSYVNELMLQANKAISQLSGKCQDIIEAFYFRNLSMEEIARTLGYSSKDVAKTSKSRCFKKLLSIIQTTN